MSKIEEAVVEISRKLKRFKEVFAVILYGSAARGDYSIRHSDIDIMVILSEIKSKNKINKIISGLSVKYRVKIHPEYQNISIKDEDQTLLCKMFEEGKILFSKGIWFMDKNDLGLEVFRLYKFNTSSINKTGRVMLSRALHGRKGFKGIVDNASVIDAGRGGLLVKKSKFKDIETALNRFKVKYKIVKTFYG